MKRVKRYRKSMQFLLALIVSFVMVLSPVMGALAEETDPPVTAGDSEINLPTEEELSDMAKDISIEWYIPNTIKIGQVYNVGAKVSNFAQEKLDENLQNTDNVYLLCSVNDGNVYPWAEFGELGYAPHSGDPGTVCFTDGSAQLMGSHKEPISAFKPGSVILQLYIAVSDEENSVSIPIGNPYKITIETPSITDNAPTSVTVGKSINFTTQLANTVLTNTQVSYWDGDTLKYRDDGLWHTAAYCPTVEVIEGQDIVKQSDQDYANTLKTSETLEFIGTGTVTLKVRYNQMVNCWDKTLTESNLYNPEKIVTIQVIDPISDETSSNIKTDISKLDFDSIYKANNIDKDADNTEIIVSETTPSDTDIQKLTQIIKTEDYSIANKYEILMTLYKDEEKVSDITENFGRLGLTLQTDATYAGRKAVVYQLHNGDEIITHEGLTVNQDGTISITVDKLSTFVVAVERNSTVDTGSQDGNSNLTNSDNPKTGDTTNVLGLILISLSSFGICSLVIRLRRRSF